MDACTLASDLQGALKLVMSLVDDFPTDDDRDDAVLISGSLRALEMEYSRERINFSDYLRERERIVRRMLVLTTAVNERLSLEACDA